MVNKIGLISRVLPFATSEVRTSCKRQDKWNKAYCFTTWYVIFLHNCFFSEYTCHIKYCISCSTCYITQCTCPVQREVFPSFRSITWCRKHRGQESQSSSIFAGCLFQAVAWFCQAMEKSVRPIQVKSDQVPGAQPLLHDARPWKEVEKANPGKGKFRLGPSALFDAVRPWIEVKKANPGQTCLGAHTVQACALHGAGFPWLLAAAFCFLASKLKPIQELTKIGFKLSLSNP